jgi:Rrf2 family protein
MKLSHASSYAIHALGYMAAQADNRLVASHHVARAQHIPERFLLKILRPLVSAGILRSVKGPNGGYRLARPAAKITLLEIIEVMDGPVRGTAPLAESSKSDLDTRLEAVCNQAAEQVRRQLGKVRLSDLAGR